MSHSLTRLMEQCFQFVSTVCAGRHASHGVTHMSKVADNAMLIAYTMIRRAHQESAVARWKEMTTRTCNDSSKSHVLKRSSPADEFAEDAVRRFVRVMLAGDSNDVAVAAEQKAPAIQRALRSLEDVQLSSRDALFFSDMDSKENCFLHRVLLVSMLHDVADHKYDTEEGGLQKRVEEFVRQQVFTAPPAAGSAPTSCVASPSKIGSVALHNAIVEAFLSICGDAHSSHADGASIDGASGAKEVSKEQIPSSCANVHVGVGILNPLNLQQIALQYYREHATSDSVDLSTGVRNQHSIDAAKAERYAQLVFTSISAISFSKEAKKGKRWFESALRDAGNPSLDDLWLDWVLVRDVASDADKLEAIGEEGLHRCYEFSVSRHRDSDIVDCAQDPKWKKLLSRVVSDAQSSGSNVGELDTDRALRTFFLNEVADHYDEKLKLLKDEYVVTPVGKEFAESRHVAMTALLDSWKRDGVTPAPLPL